MDFNYLWIGAYRLEHPLPLSNRLFLPHLRLLSREHIGSAVRKRNAPITFEQDRHETELVVQSFQILWTDHDHPVGFSPTSTNDDLLPHHATG